MGELSNSLAQIMPETSKDAGDRVRYFLRQLLTGRGRTEGQTLEGNEESLTLYYDELILGELRHATRHRNDTTIDAQRVPWNLREINYDSLRDWGQDRLDTAFFNQLAGYTAQTDLAYTGHNTPLAPSTNRVIRAGAVANDQALGAGNVMTLNLLDQARTRARRATNAIRPIRVRGEDKYVVFIAPEQAYDLRRDTTTAGNWFDLQKAKLQGGASDSESGIYSGAMGEYNGCVIHVADRVPPGVHSTSGASVANTRRAIFCGAQALGVAFGKKYGKNKFSWVEELFDYGYDLGVSTHLVWGVKKTVYNSEDYGVITLPTYAATV